ncbi:MAG: hypothetical protein IJE68_02850 [Clostridia bacterium]|nr:hypothetical protein [Clostridia bacterium]
MEDFLTKLNLVKKNNYINQLERDNQKNQERIEKYVSNFKKEITEQELEKRQNLQTIKELTESNKKLQDENNNYKYILSKIPNWIIKLFAGNKNIGGYLNGSK